MKIASPIRIEALRQKTRFPIYHGLLPRPWQYGEPHLMDWYNKTWSQCRPWIYRAFLNNPGPL